MKKLWIALIVWIFLPVLIMAIYIFFYKKKLKKDLKKNMCIP